MGLLHKGTWWKEGVVWIVQQRISYLGTTSNLRKHLHRHHKDKYKRSGSGRTKVSDSKEQTSIDTFFTCSKCLPSRAKKITELIAFTVAKVLRSAAVVNGAGFKRLLSYLEPGYAIPSSVHLFVEITPWPKKSKEY